MAKKKDGRIDRGGGGEYVGPVRIDPARLPPDDGGDVPGLGAEVFESEAWFPGEPTAPEIQKFLDSSESPDEGGAECPP